MGYSVMHSGSTFIKDTMFTTLKKYPALPGKGAIVKKSEHISPKSHNKPTTLNGVNTQKTTII
jgi:hypothetical protein